jgi:hypothetical protein
MPKNKENQKRLAREWYLRNRELAISRAKSWNESNPEKRHEIATKSRKVNAESHNAYNRDWFSKNSDKRSAYQAKRRAMLIQRTPKWLTQDDLWMIEEAYELAKKRTEMFGFEWHVDHVIPLLGKKVSGFHVPSNIQVIPGLENVRKNASFVL